MDKDGKSITQTITQVNYNYDANNGYYIDTAYNYVRYRKDADGNFADVRLIDEAGIFNAANDGANVVGKDLVLVGGNGAIGTQSKPSQ